MGTDNHKPGNRFLSWMGGFKEEVVTGKSLIFYQKKHVLKFSANTLNLKIKILHQYPVLM